MRPPTHPTCRSRVRAGRAVLAGLGLAGASGWAGAQTPPQLPPPGARVPSAVSAPGAAPAAVVRRVALVGRMGQQAVLVIDGQAPRAVKVGERLHGVRLLSLDDRGAVVERDGETLPLALGAAPVALSGRAPGEAATRVVLQADAAGHFLSPGSIHGQAVHFLVDTGASVVALGRDEATRLGLRWQQGPTVSLGTANGTVTGHRVRLDRLRLGEVELLGVDAVVVPQAMPHVLLGNSALMRFQLRRENDQLTLDRRY